MVCGSVGGLKVGGWQCPRFVYLVDGDGVCKIAECYPVKAPTGCSMVTGRFVGLYTGGRNTKG